MKRICALAIALGPMSLFLNPADAATNPKVVPLESKSVGPSYVSDAVTPTFKHVDVRTLAPLPDWQPGDPIREIPRQFSDPQVINPNPLNPQVDQFDRGAQRQQAFDSEQRAINGDAFNTPILNFPSVGNTGVSPSDVNGDVGKNHFVNSVNGSSGARIAIYDKVTGVQVGPTFSLETLGSNCAALAS